MLDPAYAKAFERLLEVVQSGVGSIAGPWQMKRMARAQVDSERILIEGRRELAALAALPPASPAEAASNDHQAKTYTLMERAHNRFEYQETKRQLNIEEIVEETLKHLSATPAEGKVDEDWTARFFSHAQDISNDEMKKLWSRVLAGEVNQPGTFSVRCLDTLRNLSPQEAQLFARIQPLVFNDQALVGLDWPGFSEIAFGDVLRLVEAGLVTTTQSMAIRVPSSKPDRFSVGLRFGGAVVLIEGPPAKGILFQFDAHKLSPAGEELAKVVPSEINLAFLTKLAVHYRNQGYAVNVHRLSGDIRAREAQFDLRPLVP